jgi:acyl-CoA dehydrogenase
MSVFDPSAEHAAIREGVAEVCAGFPGANGRDLDTRCAYPEAFGKADSSAKSARHGSLG